MIQQWIAFGIFSLAITFSIIALIKFFIGFSRHQNTSCHHGSCQCRDGIGRKRGGRRRHARVRAEKYKAVSLK